MNGFETSFIHKHYFDDMENWCECVRTRLSIMNALQWKHGHRRAHFTCDLVENGMALCYRPTMLPGAQNQQYFYMFYVGDAFSWLRIFGNGGKGRKEREREWMEFRWKCDWLNRWPRIPQFSKNSVATIDENAGKKSRPKKNLSLRSKSEREKNNIFFFGRRCTSEKLKFDLSSVGKWIFRLIF